MMQKMARNDRPDLYNPDAEEAVLGSILIEPSALPSVGQFLAPGDFFVVKNQWVYEALITLHERREPIDFLTVCNELEARNRLAEAGGTVYISQIETKVPSAAHLDGYARIVWEMARRREIIAACSDFAKHAYDLSEDINSVVAFVHEQSERFSRNGRGDECATWADVSEILGPIEWAWPNWLAAGFAALVVSKPGLGKSALILRLAECFTKGTDWPDGKPFTGQIGAVVWAEAEAGQAINLGRARSWGLPLEKILTPFDDPLSDVCLDDPRHQAAITAAARRDDVRLIVVDSLGGSTSVNDKDSEAGLPMKFLGQLARNVGKPVVASHHLRKRTLLDVGDTVDLEQVSGNVAIVKFARLVWALDTPDPGKPDVKRLACIKSNLGRFPDPLGLTISEAGVSFCSAPTTPKEPSQIDIAKSYLVDLLGDGPKLAKEIQESFAGQGLSWRSAERAKTELGIKSVKKADGWYWGLVREDEPS